MTRYALTLSYDGSQFYGWQKQTADVPTVQTALEHALSATGQHPINVTAAGRTDTGVHATAQVVHFDSDANRPISAWVRGVNAHLPDGVAVLHAQAVAPEFHARFDAFARRYRYLLQSAPVRSPLTHRTRWLDTLRIEYPRHSSSRPIFNRRTRLFQLSRRRMPSQIAHQNHVQRPNHPSRRPD